MVNPDVYTPDQASIETPPKTLNVVTTERRQQEAENDLRVEAGHINFFKDCQLDTNKSFRRFTPHSLGISRTSNFVSGSYPVPVMYQNKLLLGLCFDTYGSFVRLFATLLYLMDRHFSMLLL